MSWGFGGGGAARARRTEGTAIIAKGPKRVHLQWVRLRPHRAGHRLWATQGAEWGLQRAHGPRMACPGPFRASARLRARAGGGGVYDNHLITVCINRG